MRKELDLKLSWYSQENLDRVVEAGYLPVLAIVNPDRYRGTAIHFPRIAPRLKDYSPQEYKTYLEERVVIWKILNSFDVLTHLASSGGIVLFTDLEEDPYREILGEYLGKYLDHGPEEFRY